MHLCCTQFKTDMQKHSIKLVLKKNKVNKQKQHPIYIRITIERKSSFIATGFYVAKSMWDERNERVKDSHPSADKINLDILNKKNEVLDNMVNAGVAKKAITAADLKEMATMGEDRTNIFAFCERFTKEMAGKRSKSTTDNWEKHLRKLKEYHGSKTLDFEQITLDYLTGFEAWLRGNGVSRDERGKDPNNYIHAILKTIRGMFNAAKRKGLITCYPFKNYEMPKPTSDNKDRLTLAELDKLEGFVQETKNKRYKEVGTWFLFGCYTGLRVSDWYAFNRETDLHDGYLSLQAIKNNGRIAMPIHERLKRVLQWTKETPLTTYEQDINENLKYICKELNIKKKLTSHSGRKTFAVTICAERGIPSETCAKLLGITIKICVDHYYAITPDKVKRETDKAWAGL